MSEWGIGNLEIGLPRDLTCLVTDKPSDKPSGQHLCLERPLLRFSRRQERPTDIEIRDHDTPFTVDSCDVRIFDRRYPDSRFVNPVSVCLDQSIVQLVRVQKGQDVYHQLS